MAKYYDDSPPRRLRHRDEARARDYDDDYDHYARPQREPRYGDIETSEPRRSSKRETYDAGDEDDAGGRRRGSKEESKTTARHSKNLDDVSIPPPPIGNDRNGTDNFDDTRRSGRKDRDPDERRPPRDDYGRERGKYETSMTDDVPTRHSSRRERDRDAGRSRYSSDLDRERETTSRRQKDTIPDEPDRENLPYRPREKRSARERHRDALDPSPPSSQRRHRDELDPSPPSSQRRRNRSDYVDREPLPPRRSHWDDPDADEQRRYHTSRRPRHYDDESDDYEPPRRKHNERTTPRREDHRDDRGYLSDTPRRRGRDEVDGRGYRTDGRDSQRGSDRRRPERDSRDRYHDDRDYDDRSHRKRSSKKGGDMKHLMENGQKTWHQVEPIAKPMLTALAKKYLDGVK